MKLKSLFLGVCLGALSSAYASGVIVHAKEDMSYKNTFAKVGATKYCPSITIDNYSSYDLYVRADTTNFMVPHNRSWVIELYYNGYCHDGLYVTISTQYATIFSDYVFGGQSIPVSDSLKNIVALSNPVK